MALTSTLSDEGYQPENFPKLIPPMSFCQWLAFSAIKTVMMPYSIIVAQISIFKPNKRNEIFPTGAKLMGVRKAAFSKALDMTVIRDKLKKKKVSINDYIVVVASLAAS